MKKNGFIFIISFLIVFFGCELKSKSPLTFERMLVEYEQNPIIIDNPHPRFSWVISSSQRNQHQSAYRILVSTDRIALYNNTGDFWDSGKIISSETIQHELEKEGLKSNQKYFWRVEVWDANGEITESPVASFETALLHQDDWKAKWIGNGPSVEPLPAKGFFANIKEQAGMKDTVVHSGQSLLLRKEEQLHGGIKSAKAYITGLGFYEFYINGKRVGNHVLDPAKTPYHKEILYSTYDVTKLLKEGVNAFGIHLGNGWYNPYKKWWNQYRMQWFGHKKAIAQIEITYTNGSTQTITTDQSWRWSPGPVVFSGIYDGEVYNANLEQPGWVTVGFDDSDWKPVNIIQSGKAKLVSQTMPAIKVIQTMQPKEINGKNSNTRVFDMGQNFTGWVRIKVSGEKNTKIKIRFAEDIHDDGTIDVTSNEHAKATAEYILNGKGTETYEPRFTYFGFKYVELSAENGPFFLENVTGCVVHTDNRQIGYFECSDTLVNKIHRATVWSQKSNMLGYPMDCPQRDERLGWFGDAQVTAEEAMFNFDMARFYKNWFGGIKNNQDEKTGDLPIISPQPYIWDEGIEWSSTYNIMVWQYYIWYGDKRVLAEHYPVMKRYMHFLDSISNNYILPKGWIGDWGSLVKGWKEGQPESVPTAFYYFNATILSKVAEVLRNSADQKYFADLAEAIKKSYNKHYFNAETGNYNDGSQMANAFPLFLGIVPEKERQKVLENLVNDIVVTHQNHLTTGVLGTKYMPEALAQMGRADVAWDIINQKTYPSWNIMMEKYTTMCEFWTLKQSKNHVMMGSIDAWFYKYIAGIQPEENNPAFTSFVIKPNLLKELSYTKASTETIRGKIAVDWQKQSGRFILNIEVPFNTSALVYIPGQPEDKIFESNKPVENVEGVKVLKYVDGAHLLRVSSGKYSFIKEED